MGIDLERKVGEMWKEKRDNVVGDLKRKTCLKKNQNQGIIRIVRYQKD